MWHLAATGPAGLRQRDDLLHWGRGQADCVEMCLFQLNCSCCKGQGGKAVQRCALQVTAT